MHGSCTHQMPERCIEIWHDILEQTIGNLSRPKHRPLSGIEGIHSDVTYTIFKKNVYTVYVERVNF